MATKRTVSVWLDAKVGGFVTGMKTAEAAVKSLNREIDSSNDRTAWLAQSALALGPAFVPLGAAAVPILSGLTMQLGLAAGAAGTAALAFNGMGDGLKAVNEYQAEQTAENLEKMNLALEKVGPAGADLIRYLDDIGPLFTDLQMAAREGMFPGVEEGLDSFLDVLPRVRTVVVGLSEAMGELTAQAGAGLSGEGFADFFEYLERSAKPLMVEMGQTVGNFIEGLGAMTAAFEPLTADFSQGFLDMSRSFSDWAAGLQDSQSFADFVAYIQSVIPQVKETLGALSDAFVALVQAAAPIGGATLFALEQLFDILSAILRTPAGPVLLGVAAGISAISRGVALYNLANGSAIGALLTKGGAEGGKAGLGFRAAGAGLGIFALSMTDLDEKIGVSNAALGAMMGLVAGPWGAAVGGAIGLLLDASASTDDFKVSAEDVIGTLDQQTGALTANTAAWASNELEKQGVLSAAQRLGLDLADVTSAALGDTAAMERVTAQLAAAKATLYDDEGVPIVGTEELLEFKDNMFLVEEGIGETNGALDTAQERFLRVAEATGEAADETDRATTATQDFKDGVIRLNEILAGRASLRGYEQALDDFTARATERAAVLDELAAAREDFADADTKAEREAAQARIEDLEAQAAALESTLDVDTQAGRDTQELLDGIVARAIEFAETLEGADRDRFLKRARADFVDTTEKLLGSRNAARKLWDELVQLDSLKVHMDIIADIQDAMRKIGRVRYEMQKLDGSSAEVEVVYTASGRRFKDVPSGVVPAGADGMTVPGPRAPYGDKVLTYLAPGEEVISNRHGQADRNRELLQAINANRLADGGTVRASDYRRASYRQASSALNVRTEIDYTRLADELTRLRPLYGDVHISGDPTTFKRQMQQDRRSAAGGGL